MAQKQIKWEKRKGANAGKTKSLQPCQVKEATLNASHAFSPIAELVTLDMRCPHRALRLTVCHKLPPERFCLQDIPRGGRTRGCRGIMSYTQSRGIENERKSPAILEITPSRNICSETPQRSAHTSA
jgi:hypothetical protein